MQMHPVTSVRSRAEISGDGVRRRLSSSTRRRRNHDDHLPSRAEGGRMSWQDVSLPVRLNYFVILVISRYPSTMQANSKLVVSRHL